MKKVIGVIALVFSAFTGFSQQEYQVSQNMFNQMPIFAGYAGINESVCGHLIYRNQWLGFEGAPKTLIFSANTPLSTFGGPANFGAGLSFSSDQLGFSSLTNIKLAGSYIIPSVIANGKLGVGFDLAFTQQAFTPGNNLLYIDQGDGVVNTLGNEAGNAFELGLGMFYKRDDLWFGLQTAQNLTSTIVWADAQPRLARHYYITAGYLLPLGSGQFELEPSVFIKSDGATTQMDIATRIIFDRQFWGGLSFRPVDAAIAMVGMSREVGPGTMKIGFAYDYTLSNLKKDGTTVNGSAGSVEAFIGFCMGITPPPTHIKYTDPTLFDL